MVNYISNKFSKIGARAEILRLTEITEKRYQNGFRTAVRINIFQDKAGSYFDILVRRNVHLEVLDYRPKERALVLMASRENEFGRTEKEKYLCGHDERNWFVCALSNEATNISSVPTALESLKPKAVRSALDEKGISYIRRNRHRNEVFIRQGEWFFVPAPDFELPEDAAIHRREPLGTGGKPHAAEELYRTGGDTIFVNDDYPQGVPEHQYRNLSLLSKKRWYTRTRVAVVYARGLVTHPDHKTVRLEGWHRVYHNEQIHTKDGFID